MAIAAAIKHGREPEEGSGQMVSREGGGGVDHSAVQWERSLQLRKRLEE